MFLGSRVRPVRMDDSLVAASVPITYTMCVHRHLRFLRASTTCDVDSFMLF
jgi:hypothetical protein